MKLKESQVGFLLVLPALIVFTVIILYPFLNSIWMGFTDRSLLQPTTSFIGWDNFRNIFADPDFTRVLRNTVVFVLGGTLAPLVLGFIWALILNQGFRGSEFLRGITLVNWIIPSAAIGFLWMWIFNAHFGIVNGVLKGMGLIDENITWLGKTDTAMLVVIIAKTWQTLPWFMAFLLGGLQGVPKEQIEAGRIDGAGNWQVLRRIVLPEMKYIIYLVLILGAIGSLQHFDLIWVMTQGGPAKATTTFAVDVYRNAFQIWNLGAASAMGTIWVLFLLVFGIMYVRSLAKEMD